MSFARIAVVSWAGLSMVAVVATGACGSSETTATDAGTPFQLRLAKNHRPIAQACSARAPGTPIPRPDAGSSDASSDSDGGDGGVVVQDPPKGEACYSDAGCTAGRDGRCGYYGRGGAGGPRGCSYSTCEKDADCAVAEACVCSSLGHACVASGCRVDADCVDGFGCSPTTDPFNAAGYACHTKADECIDDSDCTTGRKNNCNFSKDKGHWACQELMLPASYGL